MSSSRVNRRFPPYNCSLLRNDALIEPAECGNRCTQSLRSARHLSPDSHAEKSSRFSVSTNDASSDKRRSWERLKSACGDNCTSISKISSWSLSIRLNDLAIFSEKADSCVNLKDSIAISWWPLRKRTPRSSSSASDARVFSRLRDHGSKLRAARQQHSRRLNQNTREGPTNQQGWRTEPRQPLHSKNLLKYFVATISGPIPRKAGLRTSDHSVFRWKACTNSIQDLRLYTGRYRYSRNCLSGAPSFGVSAAYDGHQSLDQLAYSRGRSLATF